MAAEPDMDVQYGGSTEAVVPGEQSLAELTIESYMAQPAAAGREPFMVTRFPVTMEEYRRMSLVAETFDPTQTSLEMRADVPPDEDVEPTLFREGDEVLPEESLFLGATGPASLAPTIANSFEGIRATGWQPPDNCIGVGNTDDVLVGVNIDLAGYRKNGNQRFRWPNMSTLFQSVLPSGVGLFDPRILFDHYAQRWCVVSAARGSNPNSSYLMVGVSKTADSAGSWWVYRLDATKDGSTSTSNWGDYPMVGFDGQCFYIACNMFAFNGGFQYCKLRILYKNQLYNGQPITWYDFWNLKNPNGQVAFTVQPCRHYQGTGGNPPAYMVNAIWPGGSTLTLWTINNPVGHWTGGAPSLSKADVSCRAYDLPPDAKQKDSTTHIETNDSRLLDACFQFGGGVKRLWTCQTSKISWPGDSEARSCVQWYEIDVPTNKVVQQNAYGAQGYYYYFPAIQTDLQRNAYLVFGRSSDSTYASFRQTGRKVTDAANDMQNSALVKAGESAYIAGRWGDYFGICRDGADPNRIWGYGEYAAAGGRWGTWVYSAAF